MNVNDSLAYSQFPRLQLVASDDDLAADDYLPFATLGCNERRLYDTLSRFQKRNQKGGGDECHELGRQLLQRGHYRAAWPALEIALSRRSRRAELTLVDDTLAALELLLDDVVLLPGAVVYLERALLVWRAVRHPTHPQIGELFNNLGYRHKQEGRLQDAQMCYERALLIWKEQFGMRHAYIAAVLNNLGALARRTGHTVQARHRYRQALAISHTVYGRHHPLTASILDNLGALCRDDDRVQQRACHKADTMTSLSSMHE